MFDFKKVIVGLEIDPTVDGLTRGSARAAEQAIWVARANGGSIRYLHSTYDDEYHGRILERWPVVHRGLSTEGKQALEAQVEATRAAGVPAELELSEDRVWLEITRAAIREQADLVVVGKRNGETQDGRRLGSVATKLIRKCPCPVWVVKPDQALVHEAVMAATDLETVGDLAVRCAGQIAQRHGCELHIVHAWQVPFALQMEASRMADEDYARELTEIQQCCIAHITEGLAGYEGAKKPRIHSAKGSPSGTILAAVERFSPDLLVMGTISRAGLAGVLVGSTAERLLDRVECSILAVKPEDFVSPVKLD